MVETYTSGTKSVPYTQQSSTQDLNPEYNCNTEAFFLQSVRFNILQFLQSATMMYESHRYVNTLLALSVK
jgi:hypothetical protein